MLEGRGRRTELMYFLVLVVGHLDIGQILPGTGSLVTLNKDDVLPSFMIYLTRLCYYHSLFKGTLARDFRPLVFFFIKSTHLILLSKPYIC
jgi:hypothetical protein